ncbi:MAG: FtsX-like permease family protein, partial [Thermoplasmata archaeon]|nr:FtsX-like permease family protein [Thermoplasmata archaeon]
MDITELILPGIVLGIILFMLMLGFFNKVIAKLGLRNFYRHKGHALISIAGLLVGTTIICASMVVGDSIEYFIVEETYNTLQLVDMTVTEDAGNSFNYSVYTALNNDAAVGDLTDGMAPLYAQTVTVRHTSTNQFEPSANLVGYDWQADLNFGEFPAVDGSMLQGNDLGPNDTMINLELAENLGASVDDTILLTYSIGGTYGGYGVLESRVLTIKHILDDSGKTRFDTGQGMGMGTFNIFVNMGTAQEMFQEPGMITHIKISNNGDIEGGAKNSDQVKTAIETSLGIPGPDNLKVRAVKQSSLETAKAFNDLISSFLTIFGSFAIIAGVILIINIFTMLAEERKSELGMARAVGMKRKHLMQSFLFEGLAYGGIASLLGTLAGVGVGAVLIYMVNNFIGFIDIQLPFHFQWFSLVSAFSLGFIITFGTILLTSWKISKLNIIRAIRGIDEPPKDRKGFTMPILGVLITAMAALIYFQYPDDITVKLMAPSGMIAGIGMILWRWIGDRISISGASLGVFLYTYYAIRTYFADADNNSMDILFIFSGVLIVLSIVLLIMYNSGPIIHAITGSVGRVKKWRPTIMTAVSYPLTKKFRTGMSVGMFALVVYMIVMLSVFSSMFVIDVDEETLKQGGGFDIQAEALSPVMDLGNVSYHDPTLNISVQITSSALQNNLTYTQVTQYFTLDANVTDSTAAEINFGGLNPDEFMRMSRIYGIDQSFFENKSFQFSTMAEEYTTDAQVWNALMEPGSTKVLVSSMSAMFMGAETGNHLTMKDPMTGNISQEYEIIGVLDQSIMSGIFMSRTNVIYNFGMAGMVNSVFLFDVNPAFDIKETAKALESDFALLGMNT